MFKAYVIKIKPDSHSARDRRIVEMFSEGMSLQAIGDEFQICRERVSQILEHNGIRAADRQNYRIEHQRQRIAQWFLDNPTGSTRECAEALGLSTGQVLSGIAMCKITRDLQEIRSRIGSECSRKGRVPLTKAFLYEAYIVKGKSTVQIAKETGYTSSTIGVRLRNNSIFKDRETIVKQALATREQNRADRQKEKK